MSQAIAPPAAAARRHVIGVGCLSLIGGLLYGYTLSVIAAAEPALVSKFGLRGLELGLVVSNLDLGAAAGALAAGLLGERLGRKPILIATALLYLASALLSAFADGVAVLLIGRLLGGLAVGSSLVLPLYVAEAAPAARRGVLVSFVQIGIVAGILMAYLAGWLAVDGESVMWRTLFGIGIVPAFAFLVMALRLPESPRWLVAHGRPEDALAVLSRVEGDAGAAAAMGEIQEAIRSESGGWREVFRPANRPALLVGLLVSVSSVLVGINAVIQYGPIILMRGGQGLSNALLGSVLIGAVNVVATLASVPWIDRVGRKPFLLAGLAGTAVSMAALAAFFPAGAARGDEAALAAAGGGSAGTLISVVSFVAFYAISLGPITWVLVSEVFPTRIRGPAMSVCLVVMYLADFGVTFLFPPLMSELGRVSFLVFAAISVLAAVLAFAFVPETKGRSLEEMEGLWNRGD